MLRETGITLKEALEMDCLKTCKLIAGAGGLDNIIYRANIMADPDIINWVNEGELLLTTAYFFKITEIEEQVEFIKELKKHGTIKVFVACTHGLFAGNAVKKLISAGCDEIISTDTIMSEFSKVKVSSCILRLLLSRRV